jgi:hypothetical protein
LSLYEFRAPGSCTYLIDTGLLKSSTSTTTPRGPYGPTGINAAWLFSDYFPIEAPMLWPHHALSLRCSGRRLLENRIAKCIYACQGFSHHDRIYRQRCSFQQQHRSEEVRLEPDTARCDCVHFFTGRHHLQDARYTDSETSNQSCNEGGENHIIWAALCTGAAGRVLLDP